MPFPLTPVPSYYATVTHAARRGVYYTGDTVSVTLSQPTPTNYSVNDYYGNVVETGSVNGTTLNLRGPFNPGWYRVYMTGAHTDVTYGPSYGAWSFMVIPVDLRFVTNPAQGVGTSAGGGEAHDVIMKGVLGIGTSRVQIGDVANATTGADNINNCITNAGYSDTYYTAPSDPAFDANRNRYKFLEFPNRTFDRIDINNGNFCRIYPKDTTIDTTKVFIEVVNGSSSGWKINVYYPNISTLAESYDNLANGTQAQNALASSSYVVGFNAGSTATLLAPTVMGNTYSLGVKQVVNALYPLGYTHYEGPTNEPSMGAESAQRMRIFQGNVHAANVDAKAIGPCFVDITNLAGWQVFLDAGGGNYLDEISTHAYNSQTNGDINLGRTTIEAFQAMLATYGLSGKVFWHTEATHVFTAVYGVHHPRRSRVPLLQTLLFEQYGLPRERNLVWYDHAHGFWSYPAWLNANSGPVPYMALYRTLAAETFGMTHYHRLDFGSEAANRIWLGSLYVSNRKTLGASTLVLAMNSYMPAATVDLTITGTTAAITYVDGFGNTATATQSSGRVTIPTTDIPTYVRLPAGVVATVYQVNDWGTSPPPSVSSYGTASAAPMNDDAFMTAYGGTAGVYVSTASLPEDAHIIWLANATFQRVIIFCGGAWQNLSALTTFTIDTWDGATWTTQQVVDVSAGCSSFQHGSDGNGEGCKQETYWPEQWIFDVKLPAPVTALGVRVHATNCSYGGEPDAAAKAAGGQGANAPKLSIQEIMVPSTSTPGF